MILKENQLNLIKERRYCQTEFALVRNKEYILWRKMTKPSHGFDVYVDVYVDV